MLANLWSHFGVPARGLGYFHVGGALDEYNGSALQRGYLIVWSFVIQNVAYMTKMCFFDWIVLSYELLRSILSFQWW